MEMEVETGGNLSRNNEVVKELQKCFDKRIDTEIIESVAYETNYNIDQATNCLLDMLGAVPIVNDVVLSDEACIAPLSYAGSVKISKPPSLAPKESDEILVDLTNEDTTDSRSPFEKRMDNLINDIKRGIKILILLRGVPGSGKSFLAEEIVHKSFENFDFSDFIYSADDFFMIKGRYNYKASQISEAHKWNQERARLAMKAGVSPVIIDNTNTQAWEFRPYLQWAVEEGYDIEILEPNTPWAFNARELCRRNVHGIPLSKIEDMLDRYEKNLSVEGLFEKHGICYKNKLPPQPRNYPVLKRSVMKKPEKTTIEDLFGNFNCDRSPLKPKKCDEPSLPIKPDDALKSWNVTADDLNSWNVILKPECPSLNETKSCTPLATTETIVITKNDAMTMTSYTDLASPTGIKVIEANASFDNNKGFPSKYPKEGCLDVGTITEDAHPNEEEILLLFELFRNIPEEYIREIYEKCNKQLEWATEVLLSDKRELIPNYQPKIVERNEPKEEPPVKKFIEEIKPKVTITQEQKAEIKHAIESSVTINKEHYSENLRKLKKLALSDENLSRLPCSSRIDMQTDAGTVIAIDSDSEFDSSGGSDDDLDDSMELYIGNGLIKQLQEAFGDPTLEVPQGFQPVIEIHKSLARQIYALYLESIYKQMDAQNLVLQTMIKEDEQFAKKLQNEEYFVASPKKVPSLKEIMSEQMEQSRKQKIIDEWKNLTPDDIAYKLKKQKLLSVFPSVEEETLVLILSAYKNNYQDTVDAVVASGVPMVQEVSKAKEEPISDQTLHDMKEDHLYAAEGENEEFPDDLPPDVLRVQAEEHLKKREALLNKAQSYYQRKMYEVAVFYSELARKQTRLWEKFNSVAAEQTLRVNFKRLQNFDTIDLHNLRVKEAINALDIFLDRNIMLLNGENQKTHNYLMIITGRGNNSPGNRPRIKPAVRLRLKARKLKVEQINPGLLRARILKTSPMTNQCN